MHYKYDKDCKLCNAGTWENVLVVKISGLVHKVAPKFWLWWVNRPNSRSRKNLEKWFPNINGDIKPSEYQLEILARLQKNFPDFQIEIGRGDRLMVDGKIIKGYLMYDIRNRKDYDADAQVFSTEIELQILKKHGKK